MLHSISTKTLSKAFSLKNATHTLYTCQTHQYSNTHEEDTPQQQHQPEPKSTYDEFKKVAHQSGNASKEWMTGPSSTTKVLPKMDGNDLYESTKRAVSDWNKEPKNPVSSEQEEREQMSKNQFQNHTESVSMGIKKATDSLEQGIQRAKEWIDKIKSNENNMAIAEETRRAAEVARKKQDKDQEEEKRAGITNTRAAWEQPRRSRAKKEKQTWKSQLTDDV